METLSSLRYDSDLLEPGVYTYDQDESTVTYRVQPVGEADRVKELEVRVSYFSSVGQQEQFVALATRLARTLH